MIVARVIGGMGDLVLAARLLRQITAIADVQLVVEYGSPELAKHIFSACSGFLAADSREFDTADERCLARLSIGNLVTTDFVRAEAPAGLHAMIREATSFIEPYRDLVDATPFLDGILGDALAAMGLRRHDACFVQCGLTYDGEDFLRPTPSAVLDFLSAKGLTRHQYITIGDGWDADFGFLNGRRPTKALPSGFLEKLVRELKRLRPGIAIVQVGGGGSGDDIPGTDQNLRGAATLSDSALLLAGALLHVDTEGGLVHLARAVGTRAAVFFGPTNPAYFAYDGNLALLPAGECIDCYWSTNTWMAICPLRKDSICMDSHSHPVAAERISKSIAEIQDCAPGTSQAFIRVEQRRRSAARQAESKILESTTVRPPLIR